VDDIGPLIHFTHEIDGRQYQGRYRRLPGRRIEVATESKVHVTLIEADSLEVIARRVLEKLVRGEL